MELNPNQIFKQTQSKFAVPKVETLMKNENKEDALGLTLSTTTYEAKLDKHV